MQRISNSRRREVFKKGGPNSGILIPEGRYEHLKCEAGAALDQRCRAKAIVRVDEAPLCHFHARQAYDREFSEVRRLDYAATLKRKTA